MTDKDREQERARGESQAAFEKRLNKEYLAQKKQTQKLTKKQNAGISGIPTDALAEPGEARGEKGKKLKKEKKDG